MGKYLLSTYTTEDAVDDGPSSPEEMQEMVGAIIQLEADMDATGTFVFGGALHGSDAATVVTMGDAGVVMTDGPFAEAKEHIAGFYIIEAPDLDAALEWAGRVSSCVNRSIEVSPFAATGRVIDHMGETPDG